MVANWCLHSWVWYKNGGELKGIHQLQSCSHPSSSDILNQTCQIWKCLDFNPRTIGLLLRPSTVDKIQKSGSLWQSFLQSLFPRLFASKSPQSSLKSKSFLIQPYFYWNIQGDFFFTQVHLWLRSIWTSWPWCPGKVHCIFGQSRVSRDLFLRNGLSRCNLQAA